MGRSSWILLAGLATVLGGCTPYRYEPPSTPVRYVRSSRLEGLDSSAEDAIGKLASPEDAVVRVVGPRGICSGTLISRALVLTSRRCVTPPAPGGPRREDAPEAPYVELGGDAPPLDTIDVAEVVTEGDGRDGRAQQIAVLVLASPVDSITPLALGLDVSPTLGEVLAPVGFGQCGAFNGETHRQHRADGHLLQVRAAEVEIDESVCVGDAGGPAIDADSHEVMGVVDGLALWETDASPMERGRVAQILRIDTARRLLAEAGRKADALLLTGTF